LVRRIRELLYSQCFTISGARNRLEEELLQAAEDAPEKKPLSIQQIRDELTAILNILGGPSPAVADKKTTDEPHDEANAPSLVAAHNSAPTTPELFSTSEEGAIED
jgi:hypothetical protein